MKSKYDGVCQEVETKRKKIESSFDSRYYCSFPEAMRPR